MVRRELDRFDGREVKTIGDGFLVAFDGAPRGRCAAREAIVARVEALGMSARRAAHRRVRGARRRRRRDGGAHRRARGGARAPGEVLASGTVYGTVVGGGVRFKDRGTHRLRDVPGRWPLFGVL